MPKVHNYGEVVDRVRQHQAAKRASIGTQNAPAAVKVPEEDPAKKGEQTPPERPDESASAQNLPTNRKPLTDSDGPGAANVPGSKIEGVGATGTDVPTTVDGKPKEDAATSPTTELSKIATTVGGITGRIRALQGGTKTAAATPAAATAQANKEAAAGDAIASDIHLDTDMLVKLSSIILATEEGRGYAESVLVKAAGAEAAAGILKTAAAQHQALVDQAATYDEYTKSAAFAQQQELLVVEQMLKDKSQRRTE